MTCLGRGVRTLAAVVAACLLLPGDARAQFVEGRVDVATGVAWVASATVGVTEARLTTADGGSRVLFETRSELTAFRGLEATVHVRVAPFLRIGATVSSSRGRLATHITDDAEGAPDVTLSERVTEFVIGGTVLADLTSARHRARPFVSAGAAHLRHLHEGRPLVETGRTFHVGGGLDYLLRGTRSPAVGVRADVRAVLRSRGLFFDAGVHVSPAAGGSLFVRF